MCSKIPFTNSSAHESKLSTLSKHNVLPCDFLTPRVWQVFRINGNLVHVKVYYTAIMLMTIKYLIGHDSTAPPGERPSLRHPRSYVPLRKAFASLNNVPVRCLGSAIVEYTASIQSREIRQAFCCLFRLLRHLIHCISAMNWNANRQGKFMREMEGEL